MKSSAERKGEINRNEEGGKTKKYQRAGIKKNKKCEREENKDGG